MRSSAVWAEGVATGVALAPYTTLRVGGPARWFFRPRDVTELARILEALARGRVPVYLLGSGSNLLVADEGVAGAVVSLAALRRVRRLGPCEVEAGAGVRLPALVRWAERQGLSGLEACVGIPGSVGGALALNAGGREGTFGDAVVSATVVTPAGALRTLPRSALGLGYRRSRLGGAAVAAVRLRLRPDEPARIRARACRLLAYRRATQPLQAASAGCIFKNPPGGPAAGRLLEEAGMKGRRRGRATFSEKHANFILNEGGAKARDVRDLIREGRDRVLARFGILLEPEVVAWPRRD